MKKWLLVVLGMSGLCGYAQVPGIGDLVGKVARAVDLAIQRIQTQTILAEELEEELQNAMSVLRLGEINDWISQQKDLYAEYFQELRQVKSAVAGYHRVAETVQRQKAILALYGQGLSRLAGDGRLSPAEGAAVAGLYANILAESSRDLQALTDMLLSVTAEMSDEERLTRIDQAAAAMDRCYRDMQALSNRVTLLSLQRAGETNDIENLKKLYGL
jgi:hypothetical protein